jgi:hypothetical protein
MQYFSEKMLIIVDYLVDPKDHCNLRRTDMRMRKCLPDRFGTTLEVFLKTADRMRRKKYIVKGKEVYLDVEYFLYWDVSKEEGFPFDSVKFHRYDLDAALRSVKRSRKNSDRFGDVEVLFLADQCIANTKGDSLNSVLKIASQIDSINTYRDLLLESAFRMNIDNVVPVLKNLFSSESDYPLADEFTFKTLFLTDDRVKKQIIELRLLNLDASDVNGKSLLLDNVCTNPSIAITLIECRANVHARNQRGETALDRLIAENPHSPDAAHVAKLLLEKGLKLNQAQREWLTSLNPTPLSRYLCCYTLVHSGKVA